MDSTERKPSVEGNSCEADGSSVDGMPASLAPTIRMPHLHKLEK